MAGAACKIIINHVQQAVAQSLEQVLTSPLVRGPMISAADCDRLLQELADLDVLSYQPDAQSVPSMKSQRGLGGIIAELYQRKVFTDEVFCFLRHPDNPWVPKKRA